GVDNGDLDLRLVVFAATAVEAPPLACTAALPVVDEPTSSVLALSRTHERLRDLPVAVRWCTVLEGTLPPAAQDRDLLLQPLVRSAVRPMVTTEKDAGRLGVLAAMVVACG